MENEFPIDGGVAVAADSWMSFLDRTSGKLLIVGWLFAIAVAWCFIRSHYDNWGRDGLGETVVPLGLRALVMLAMLAPALLLIRQDSRLAWLAGLSISLGTVPLLPLLPFLRDYTHLVLMIWSVAIVRSLLGRAPLRTIPSFVMIFLIFMAICLLSASVNFALFQNLWQLKVSIAYLILFGVYALLMLAIALVPEQAEIRVDNLLDGFVWGVAGQTLVALVAIPLIFYIPFSEGNDTVFGLGYYDRYKSTLSGPVSLGMYFVISVPLLLLWMHRCGILTWPAVFRPGLQSPVVWLVMGYVQLMPWFMMATGSRTARVTFVVTLLALLVNCRTRIFVAWMLPSTVVAYLVGFFSHSLPTAFERLVSGDSHSLPTAFERLVSGDIDSSGDLSDRFFSMPDRVKFAKETISAMLNASRMSELIGFGPGVGGYRISGFPEPHNFLMNKWAETGLLGLIALVGVCVTLIWALAGHASASQQSHFSARMLLITLSSFMVVNIAYDPTYWGLAMGMLLVMVAAVVAFDARSSSRIDANRNELEGG